MHRRLITFCEVIELKRLSAIAAAAAALLLIFDSQTAIQGAAEALQLCIRTAVPSLFPFFVLSGLLVPYSSRLRIPWLGKLLHLPNGWESIFLLGCLGGYPVGTQCVAQGYQSGKLEPSQARRMLGFCTNCGPSFIFGIVGSAFSNLWSPLAILSIGITSAAVVGAFWPGSAETETATPVMKEITLPQAVQQAIRSMASVCAWIILGRVALAFLSKWLLWRLPAAGMVFVTGTIELTNGCLSLSGCSGEGIRFIIACAMVSFGGLCVVMQVASLCANAGLDSKAYLPQKALQSTIAAILAGLYLNLPGHPLLRLAAIAASVGAILFLKKAVAIPAGLVYNSSSKGGI